MKRTLLMIVGLFPPSASIGAKRPLRFARHLSAHGWRSVVLTREAGAPAESDLSLLSAVPPDARVVRDYAPRWLWALRNRVAARASIAPEQPDAAGPRAAPWATALASGLGRHLSRWVPVDDYALFAGHALRAALRLVREERPDAIYASGYPFSALLVAAALKRRTGLPLLAELRDPWTLNVQFQPRPRLLQSIERRWERRLFAEADRVIVTTEACREVYERLYPALPRGRVRCIYSAYDEQLAPAEPTAPHSGVSAHPFTVVHFGNFYGPRRAEPMLRALARFRHEQRLAAGELRFRVFGELQEPADRTALRELDLADCVEVLGKIPYAEGVAALRSADLLHLPAFGQETLYIPGKLYDYLLAGRPILCETASAELADIIERTRTGVSVAAGDVDALLGGLRAAWQARATGTPMVHADRGEIERFSAPAVTRELAHLLEEVAPP